MPASLPKLSDQTNSPGYERHKERAKARSAAQVLVGQDIGAIPTPRNLARRQRARTDFRFFCEAYFPSLFSLAWSKDHLRVISKIERTVIDSETFAVAMPRGAGKTTLCMIAVIWAILEGYHPFVFLIASTAEYATGMLDNIKSILSINEELLADYPEAIYPIRSLQGESRRCSGQRYYGVRTHIGWDADQLIMPTIPSSRCSGAIIRVAGITGNIRGANFIRPDGSSVRPTLAIIDDPQTDASARSPAQVRQRLSIVNGAVAGLAGPGKKIARIVPCTVICESDLADSLLNREKNPEWQGERTKMVYSFPTDEKLWGEYARIRADSFRNGGNGDLATEFYREHRAEMDAGAAVAWEERKNPDEISAIQHAMNLKVRDFTAFFAEYQNQPLPSILGMEQNITADDILAKANGFKRGEIPSAAHRLTAFIDVQGSLLYYMVCAWEDDFTGYIVDYGSHPDQGRDYFTLADAKKTMQEAHPNKGLEGVIFAGLEAACERVLTREWIRDDGTTAKVERCAIDANWSKSTEVVYQFCRQTKHAAVVIPSHGKGYGASSVPISQYKRKKGERMGLNWYLPSRLGTRTVRHLIIDANFWKSFCYSRLAVSMGDPGCLSIFSGWDHQMLADQLTAEYGVETTARGRTVVEWKIKPGRPDNHLFDCLVGCAVGASMQGVAVSGMPTTALAPPRKRKQRSVTYL